MSRPLPKGYRIMENGPGRFLLVRNSDRQVVARVDDLGLLLKRMRKDDFVMSLYEHDEWQALEAFYSYCYHFWYQKYGAVNKVQG